MTVRAYFDVWCDVESPRCTGWADGATALQHEGRSRARKRARAMGWKPYRTESGARGDACPDCVKWLAEGGVTDA